MKNYKAILFHPEGDYVSDFTDRKEIQEVWEEVSEMGSRWIFYPIPFVATNKTIVDTIEGLEWMKGKRITTIQKFLRQIWEQDKDNVCKWINEGWPLSDIYGN